MVGWSRRADESAAKQRRYNAWFDTLPPDEQNKIRLEEAERWKHDKPKLIVTMILGFLVAFVLWPLAAYWMSLERSKTQWDIGKVISSDSQQICKEIEYCAPCSPIHHWHKQVFCKQIGHK